MIKTEAGIGVALAAAVLVAAAVSERGLGRRVDAQATQMPVFQVDTAWPQKLPYNWIVGHVPSVAVDSRDHLFMLTRPNTLPPEDRARSAPPVIEFDQNGKFVTAWGGPGIPGFDWPDSEHGIAIDYRDNVWIGGSAPVAPSLRKLNDDMLLKFTRDGKFLLQIGGRDKSATSLGKPGGNKDPMSVHQSADVFVHRPTNEAFVADGYGNRRVVVFDADTGAFKRMWGAFGNEPIDVIPASAASAVLQLQRAGDGGWGATRVKPMAADVGLAAVDEARHRSSTRRVPEHRSSAAPSTASKSRTMGSCMSPTDPIGASRCSLSTVSS